MLEGILPRVFASLRLQILQDLQGAFESQTRLKYAFKYSESLLKHFIQVPSKVGPLILKITISVDLTGLQTYRICRSVKSFLLTESPHVPNI